MAVELQGIRQSLSAPGVNPRMPSQPSPIGEAMQALLGQTAQTLEEGVRVAEVDDIRRAMEAESQNKPVPSMLTKKGVDFAFERRAAMDMAAMSAEDWKAEADRKTTEAPDMDMAQFVQQRIDVRAANAPAAYRNYIRQHYVTNITRVLDQRAADAKEAHFNDAQIGWALTGDESQLDQLTTEYTQAYPGNSPKEFQAKLYATRAKTLVGIGDKVAVEDTQKMVDAMNARGLGAFTGGVIDAAKAKYAANLKDTFVGELDKNPDEARWLIQRAKSELDSRMIDAESHRALVDSIQSEAGKHIESSIKDSIMANQPVEPLWNWVDEQFKLGVISESQRTSNHSLLYSQVKAQVKVDVENNYLNTGLTAARVGQFSSMQDLDVTLPDGTHKTIKTADAWNKIEPMLAQEAQNDAIKDLQSGKIQPKPGEKPEDAGFRVAVKYHTATLAKNGQTSQAFKNDLLQGMNSVSANVTLASGKAEPAFVRGLIIWRAMVEQDPATANRHFGENIKHAEFYKQASREYDRNPDIAAVAMAMAQTNQNVERVAPVAQQVITKLFTKEFDGVSNQAEMQQIAHDYFRDLRSTNPQLTPDALKLKSLEYVSTNYYALDGGLYKIDPRNPSIDPLTIKTVKDRYADKYAKEERLSYDYLQIVPQGDQLVIMDTQTGMPWPVAHANESGVGTFSREQLTAIAENVRFANAEHQKDLLAKDPLALALEPGKLGLPVQGSQAVEIQRHMEEAQRALEDGQYWKWWKIREKEHLKELGREIGGAAQAVWQSRPVQTADLIIRGFGK